MMRFTHCAARMVLVVAALGLAVVPTASADPSGSFDSGTGKLTVTIPGTPQQAVGISINGAEITVCNTCGTVTAGVDAQAVRSVDVTAPGGVFLEYRPLSNAGGPVEVTVHSTSSHNTISLHSNGLANLNLATTTDGLSLAVPSGSAKLNLDLPGIEALTVLGTASADTVNLSELPETMVPYRAPDGSVYTGLTVDVGSGADIVKAPRQSVKSDIDLGGGQDRAWGGKGHDRIYGGGGDDVIYGLEGPDTIEGQGGNDRLIGGPGGDRIGDLAGDTSVAIGGSGRDSLAVKTARLTVSGGPGRDQIDVNSRRVRRASVQGGPGSDSIFVRDGQRHLSLNCGAGRDRIEYFFSVMRNCEVLMYP